MIMELDMNDVYLIEFKSHGSHEDGFLTAIEEFTGLPFAIQRVYTVTNTKNDNVRGFHAHRQLEQVFFAVHGCIDVMVEDQDGNQEFYTLNKPNVGLYCGPKIWHTLKYHDEAALMVLASQVYNEADYIRNYDDFKNYRE